MLQATIFLSDVGRHDEAIALLKSVIEKNPASIPARYQLARVQEHIGDLKSALGGYAWFAEGDESPFILWQQQQERQGSTTLKMSCASGRHPPTAGPP